jgi:hypothetical protein
VASIARRYRARDACEWPARLALATPSTGGRPKGRLSAADLRNCHRQYSPGRLQSPSTTRAGRPRPRPSRPTPAAAHDSQEVVAPGRPSERWLVPCISSSMARDWPPRPRVPDAAARVDRWAAFLPDPPIVSPGRLPATDTTATSGRPRVGTRRSVYTAEIAPRVRGRRDEAAANRQRRGRPFRQHGIGRGRRAGPLHRRSSFIGRDPEKEWSGSSTPRGSRPRLSKWRGRHRGVRPGRCPRRP